MPATFSKRLTGGLVALAVALTILSNLWLGGLTHPLPVDQIALIFLVWLVVLGLVTATFLWLRSRKSRR